MNYCFFPKIIKGFVVNFDMVQCCQNPNVLETEAYYVCRNCGVILEAKIDNSEPRIKFDKSFLSKENQQNNYEILYFASTTFNKSSFNSFNALNITHKKNSLQTIKKFKWLFILNLNSFPYLMQHMLKIKKSLHNYSGFLDLSPKIETDALEIYKQYQSYFKFKKNRAVILTILLLSMRKNNYTFVFKEILALEPQYKRFIKRLFNEIYYEMAKESPFRSSDLKNKALFQNALLKFKFDDSFIVQIHTFLEIAIMNGLIIKGSILTYLGAIIWLLSTYIQNPISQIKIATNLGISHESINRRKIELLFYLQKTAELSQFIIKNKLLLDFI